MKSRVIILITVLLYLFSSCSSNIETIESKSVSKETIVTNSKHMISEAEAVVFAKSYLMKSPLKSKSIDEEVKATIKILYRPIAVGNELSRSNSLESIPLYIISFSDKNDYSPRGFVVKVGDDRVPNGILSFSDEGIWDLSGIPEFEQFFLEQTDAYITEKIRDYSNMFSNEVDPCDTGFIQEIIFEDNKRCNLNITWNQSPSPYNDNLPAYTDGKVSPAGCVAIAIAIAQIMSYHQKPTNGSYVHPVTKNTVTTSYNWAGMKSAVSATTLSAESKSQVANLIAEIGYKVEMRYGYNSSTAYSYMAPSCFQKMGYKSTAILKTYNEESVVNEIKSNYPVYMRGDNDAYNTGHAWVVEGYKRYGWVEKQVTYCPNSPVEEIETGNKGENLYLYFNLGWNGNGDGYYLASETGIYPSSKFVYNENIQIITNIRPN